MNILHRHVTRPIIVIAHTHDDYQWFRLWFTIATVTASIVFNLGIFTLLVALHMALDIIKYRTKYLLNWHWTFIETLRESLVDVFFIVLGILLAVSFHHAIAIGGLGRLAEAEVLLLNLMLRVGPRLKIAEHLLEVVTYWQHHFAQPFQPKEKLSKSEKALCTATLITGLAVIVAPLFTAMSYDGILQTIKKELTPRLEISITKTITDLRSSPNTEGATSAE